MRLVWSREARENLIEIEDFIARDSLERAIRFIDALIDHAEGMMLQLQYGAGEALILNTALEIHENEQFRNS